jgi:hypothetical protein
MFECQLFVVDPHLMEKGCLEVVYMDFIECRVHCQFIGTAMAVSRSESTSGDPHRKRMRMMVTTPSLSVRQISL